MYIYVYVINLTGQHIYVHLPFKKSGYGPDMVHNLSLESLDSQLA